MSNKKILIAHNYYAQRGGEDVVFESEVELLRTKGHEVATLTRSNEQIGASPRVALALGAIWNRESYEEMVRLIELEKPSIVHIHNTLPQLSNSIVWAAYRKRVPVVQTLHNFRLMCPQAMFLRNGEICEDCLGKMPIAAIKHRCYKGSRIATVVNATSVVAHRRLRTFDQAISAFIALSAFSKKKFVDGGIRADKIFVKPNTISIGALPSTTSSAVRTCGIFVGRLSQEKGIDVLLDALDILGERRAIKVAGDGPLRASVASSSMVEYLGFLSEAAVQASIKASTFVVVPSTCYENFPRAIVEAYSHGVPVIASDVGAMADLVQHEVTGLLFRRGDPQSLSEALRYAADHPNIFSRMGENAKKTFIDKYSPDSNYETLMTIYERASWERNRV